MLMHYYIQKFDLYLITAVLWFIDLQYDADGRQIEVAGSNSAEGI